MRPRRAATTACIALAAAAAVAAVSATALTGTANAAPGAPAKPAGSAGFAGVSAAAQSATLAYWTPARMESATPDLASGPAAGPPGNIPHSKSVNGVRTVGALFYTTGSERHFCTGSVLQNPRGDSVLTAAHCVYSGGAYNRSIEFVPGYHNGRRPYGAYPVSGVDVGDWPQDYNPNLDTAFLTVRGNVESRTGALKLGFNEGYAHSIEVIGYNDSANLPIECATRSFRLTTRTLDQMAFYCTNYNDGTSGSPLILNYNQRTGGGTVFGDLGGYERGGDFAWESYSPYFCYLTCTGTQ